MGQYIRYNQNSKEYQELINSFLNKFESYFKDKNKTEQLKKLFQENLLSIKKHHNETSFKHPLLGNLNGVYNGLTKELEYTSHDEGTVFHEMFHAVSLKARTKRDSFIKFMVVVYLGQKQLSVREFEEGMTEYLTTCLLGEDAKNIRFNFPQETTIINKLAKIYSDDIILDYYLGLNNTLEDLMNQDFPNGFKEVINLCQKASTNGEIPIPFESTKYYKRNGESIYDNFLFELFTKKKLVEVRTIDDFKHNIKELFSFYEADLYKVCYDISIYEESLNNATEKQDNNLININKYKIESSANLLNNFNSIIRREWEKLGISDEFLYNNIIINEIENFNEFATPIIIDYLNYWNKDIKEIYKQRKVSIEQESIQIEKTTSSKKEELADLKDTLLKIIPATNLDYQSTSKSHHR